MITKIMIAEDNTSIFSCYQNFLSKDKTLEIVGHTQDGIETIKMYKDKKPDLLILDLKIPKKDGLEVLSELLEYEKPKPKCNVIIASGKPEIAIQLLNMRKVFMKLDKPINFDMLEQTIKDFQREQVIDTFSKEKCQQLLSNLNVNPISSKGRILIEAIQACYSDYSLLDNMELLYSTLGYRYSCSPQKIKSSLRSTINNVNKNTNYETLSSIFKTEIVDPTFGIAPKHFINGLIYSLKQ